MSQCLASITSIENKKGSKYQDVSTTTCLRAEATIHRKKNFTKDFLKWQIGSRRLQKGNEYMQIAGLECFLHAKYELSSKTVICLYRLKSLSQILGMLKSVVSVTLKDITDYGSDDRKRIIILVLTKLLMTRVGVERNQR